MTTALMNELIKKATEMFNEWGGGMAEDGRFKICIVGVGRPSRGQSSAITSRVDFYLDGKRVSREIFTNQIKSAEVSSK